MGSGPIFLDQLQCSGSEQSLLDCSTFTDVGLHSCNHAMDAGVKCRGLYMSIHRHSRGLVECIPHDLFTLTDVNECETEEALCDPNADCTDVLTSYSCQCRQGFEGNGFNCTGMKFLCSSGLSCSWRCDIVFHSNYKYCINHSFTQMLMSAPEISVDVRTLVKTLKAATSVYVTEV